MIDRVIIEPLDLLRARLLKLTLKSTMLRTIFLSRFHRSVVTIALSIVCNFLLMIYFPLWTLLIIPGFLGVLHLIGSLTTFHKTAAPQNLVDNNVVARKIHQILMTACFFFGCFRVLIYSASPILLENFRLIDISIVLIAYFAIIKTYSLSLVETWLSFLFLVVMSLLMHKFPSELWGLFILSHNFLAFVFWYIHAKERREKALSIISLMIFISIHVWVLSKFSDSWLESVHVNQNTTVLFGYSFFHIAHDLFPNLLNLDLARKIVMLLVFGQGVHYVLWIKIIPECHMELNKPISFRASFRRLKNEWGDRNALVNVTLILIFGVLVLFFRIDLVNDLFFAIAFFHVYAEYMALTLRGQIPRLDHEL